MGCSWRPTSRCPTRQRLLASYKANKPHVLRLEPPQVHLERRGLPLAPDVAVPDLAAATTGFTGADLANLVNEAALLAGRAHKAMVSMVEFDAAILRAVAGIEKKRSILQVRF